MYSRYRIVGHGAPYGADGEELCPVNTLRAAGSYCRSALHPGQRADVLLRATGELVARWACGPGRDDKPGRVYLDVRRAV